MWLYIIQSILNTRFTFYNGGLIMWKKYVVEGEIKVVMDMIYFVGIQQYILSKEQYTLSKNLTLKTIISGYKKVIDDLNIISKNN